MTSKRDIKVGKLVRYTGDFCRSTGNYSPPTNGIVLAVEDRDDRSGVARVVWSDNTDHAVSVLLVNLELDPVVKDITYPDLVREFAKLA